jgi:hypothetical protein
MVARYDRAMQSSRPLFLVVSGAPLLAFALDRTAR